MEKHLEYDVFISYRRATGVNDARLLQQALQTRGYNVFFDYNSLRDGKFDDRILRAIEEAKVFVLVLTEGALDKCSEDGDWVRNEIEHAIKCGKKIVPVKPSDQPFEFPEALPQSIIGVKTEQISELNKAALFEVSVDEIVRDRFSFDLKTIKTRRRFWLLPGILLAFVVCFGGISAWVWADKLFPYPVTARQKGLVDTLVGHTALLCTAYNEFLSAEKGLLDAAETAASTGKMGTFHEKSLEFSRNVKRSKTQVERASKAMSDFIVQFRDMPIDYAGIPVFLESTHAELEYADETVPALEHVCSTNYPWRLTDRLSVVKSYRDAAAIRSELFACSVMGIFCNISDSALTDFRKMCEVWTSLDGLSGTWMRDEKEIESRGNSLCNRLEKVLMERAAVVGKKNSELAYDAEAFRKHMLDAGVPDDDVQKMLGVNAILSNIMTELSASGELPEQLVGQYRKQLMATGATEGQADAQIAKLRKMAEMKKKLSEVQGRLVEAQDRLREKFAPKNEDDTGMLWGKVLRFMKANMPSDAQKCIELLRRRNAPEFPPAALDVAEAFFKSDAMKQTGGGLLVCSYDPPTASHAIFRIGDIITTMDGRPCRCFEDYRTKAGSVYTIYRRAADGGFEKITATMPDGQPRVSLANLSEQEDQPEQQDQQEKGSGQ
jgi:hypothetical protein